jgi:hypothetical protein
MTSEDAGLKPGRYKNGKKSRSLVAAKRDRFSG